MNPRNIQPLRICIDIPVTKAVLINKPTSGDEKNDEREAWSGSIRMMVERDTWLQEEEDEDGRRRGQQARGPKNENNTNCGQAHTSVKLPTLRHSMVHACWDSDSGGLHPLLHILVFPFYVFSYGGSLYFLSLHISLKATIHKSSY